MYWQMLLPYFVVTDGIATIFSRCCANWWFTTIVIVAFLANFAAKVADGIATILMAMFGRCYCQVAVAIATVVDSSCLADVNAKVADGMPTMGVNWQML